MSPALMFWFLGGIVLISLYYLLGAPLTVANVILGGVPLVFIIVVTIMITREKRKQKGQDSKSGVIPPDKRKPDIF